LTLSLALIGEYITGFHTVCRPWFLINTWRGWAQPDICPDCGGKLEKLEKVEGW